MPRSSMPKRIFNTEKEMYKNAKSSLSLIDFVHRLRFFRDNIKRAINRGDSWAVNITALDCMRVAEEQKWKCAISDRLLEFERGGTYWQNKWCNLNSAVNDRIDSSKDYTTDNLQILTHFANTWKSNFTHEQLVELSAGYLKNLNNDTGRSNQS